MSKEEKMNIPSTLSAWQKSIIFWQDTYSSGIRITVKYQSTILGYGITLLMDLCGEMLPSKSISRQKISCSAELSSFFLVRRTELCLSPVIDLATEN
jgi:hypothetical protein